MNAPIQADGPVDGSADDIVLVDDDPMVAEFMRRVLRGSGRTVHAFDDPERALAYLEGRLVRVLVVDMRMPTMSGPELLARLAARGEAGGEQVVLCSASRAVAADVPSTVKLISKDALLDRRTLLEQLGGPLPACDAPTFRHYPSSAAESSGSTSNRSPTSP